MRQGGGRVRDGGYGGGCEECEVLCYVVIFS